MEMQTLRASQLDDTEASTSNETTENNDNFHEINNANPDESRPIFIPVAERNSPLPSTSLGEFKDLKSFLEPTQRAPIEELWVLPNLKVTIGEGSGQKSSPFSIPIKRFEDYCNNHEFSAPLLQKFVAKGPMFEHHFVFGDGSRTPSHLEIAMATFEHDCFFCLFRYDIAKRSAVCLLFVKTLDYLKTRTTSAHQVKDWLRNYRDLLSRHPFLILSVVLSFMQNRAHEYLRIRINLYDMESHLGVTRNGQLLIERGYGEVCYDFGLLNADLAGISKQIADTELSASTMMGFAKSIEQLLEKCEKIETLSDSASGQNIPWPVSEQREEIRSTITRAELYLKHTKMAQAIVQSLEAVLYNRINKQDTDAMKTIAVVTLVFLPATFVSAVFSTGVFNFQASESPDKPQTISKYGWVYLLVCILSTSLTLLSWVCWYRWGRHWMEKKEFNKMQKSQKQIAHGLSNPKPFPKWSNAFPISRPEHAYTFFPPDVPRRREVFRRGIP